MASTVYIKKRLYDGAEPETQAFPLAEFGFGNVKLRVGDFINNPLRKLEEQVQPDFFENIVQQFDLAKVKKLFVKYIDADKLEVFFRIQGNSLLIVSFGEFQPSRFIVNFLGALESVSGLAELPSV